VKRHTLKKAALEDTRIAERRLVDNVLTVLARDWVRHKGFRPKV